MAIYLLTGDPWFRNEAVQKIKQELLESGTWDETPLDGEDFAPQRFVEALQSPSLFGDGVLIHLKRVDKLKDTEALLPYLEQVDDDGYCVIIEGDKLDKRSKLFKTLKKVAKVEEYGSPAKKDLPTAVAKLLRERNVSLSQPAFRYLLENVQSDMARIGSEVEKLAIYANGQELDETAVRGLLFHDKEGDLFSALDTLMERKIMALMRLEALLNSGEEPSKIFYMLARQVRSLIKTKSLADEGAKNDVIAKRTGDFPWLVSKRRALVAKLSLVELVGLLHRLHEEDLLIKRGERQPEEALWAIAMFWTARQPVHSTSY